MARGAGAEVAGAGAEKEGIDFLRCEAGFFQGFGECFGGECTDRDADNNEVAAYCTEGCGLDVEGDKSFCPDGYVCVNTGSDVCLKL